MSHYVNHIIKESIQYYLLCRDKDKEVVYILEITVISKCICRAFGHQQVSVYLYWQLAIK